MKRKDSYFSHRRPVFNTLVASMLAVTVLGLAACGGNETTLAYKERTVEDLYNRGLTRLDNEKYDVAYQYFNEVERQHPYSIWATKAQLMAAYAKYKEREYDEAVAALDRFLELHPSNRDVPYALYLKGLSYFEQIVDVGRDQRNSEKALEAFNQLIRRYPNSKYSRDANIKIDMARDHLAGKEMVIGRYYLTRNHYLAALNRFKNVVEQYDTTTHVEEALYRLVEVYSILGLDREARRAAAVLGHNYPGGDWYEDSYELVKDTQGLKSPEAIAKERRDERAAGQQGQLPTGQTRQ